MSTSCIRHASHGMQGTIPVGAENPKKTDKTTSYVAEGVGFEPTVRINRTLDFESSPFDHSGIPPRANLSGRSARGKRRRQVSSLLS